MKTSDTVCAVVDNGQFVEIARALGRQVKKCYYWSPADRSLPLIQEAVIGSGFPEMERVSNIWKIKDKCDFFVFPDLGHSGLQKELIAQGFPVWGARDGDRLESDRGLFFDTLKELGMEVPPHEVIEGITNLRLFLKDKEDKWVKISKWRGNFETFHWVDWEQTEPELDDLAVEFGSEKEDVLFYVCDPIETDIEDGVDSYCIDGWFPDRVLHGMEHKDKSFIGTMCDWDDLPEQVKLVNNDIAEALKKFDYRGFFSTEVRILPDKFYFIDPTCRAASPPHQLMTEIFKNFADILYQGAQGDCINPIDTAEFGVQALLSYKRNEKEWVKFKIPESIERNVKCGFCYQKDGLLCFPPHPLETMAGYLVATGDSIKEAIGNLQDAAKELPPGLECADKTLAELLKEIAVAEKHGMEFTPQEIPEPVIVLED